MCNMFEKLSEKGGKVSNKFGCVMHAAMQKESEELP